MTVPYATRPLFGTSAEDYIDEVIGCVPPGPERQRIELELRARLDPQITIEQAISRYGHPRDVAEFYLASVPLESAPLVRRLVGAMIDLPSVIATGILFSYFAWKAIGFGTQSFIAAIAVGNPLAVFLGIGTLALMSPMYYIVAESWTGRTVGKALMGLRTVRESGAKISVGQAIVRQIPLVLGIYLFDVLFVPFTKKRQRLFEMISKTRVVRG